MPSLAQELDKKLLSEQELKKDRIRSGKFSPSNFGYCFRKQVFSRMNVPQSNPPDIRSLRVFKAGSIFHDFFQGLLPEHEIEVKIETDDICGYADIVIKESKTVVDIKTMHSKGFWYLAKAGNVETQKFHNILQVMTYVYLLGYEKGKLVFTDKDTLCIEEYDFTLDAWKEVVELEINTLKGLWQQYKDNGTLPLPAPRVFGNDKKTGEANECVKYCSYRDHCYKLQNKPLPRMESEND